MLLGSLLLHITAALILPGIKFERLPESKPTLVIELEPPKPAEKPLPKPEAVIPEPTPQPAPPPEKVQPQPKEKPPEVKPPDTKPLPAPTPATEAPPVMTAAPKADTRPSETIPVPSPVPSTPTREAAPAPVAPPAPAKPSGPSEEELENARVQYGKLVRDTLEKHKKYPNIAIQRGYEGTVELEVIVDDKGKIVSVKVSRKSPYPVLDEAAVEMARNRQIPLPPSEMIRGKLRPYTVPVPFKLDKEDED